MIYRDPSDLNSAQDLLKKELFEQEISNLRQIKHINVIKILETVITDNFFCLVTPYEE